MKTSLRGLAASFIVLLTVSSVLPSLFPGFEPAHAVTQVGPTSWSPFGPQARNLLITVYSDFQAMFNAFTSGQVDITDWPAQPADIPGFASNPDFYLTTPTSEFGIFELDINHHASFLGKPQQTARIAGTPGIVGTPTTSSGCSTGFGQLNVILENIEEGNTVILDSLNKLKATGPVSVSPVTDDPSEGSSIDGTYVLPSPTACFLAGTYTISTTVYSGSANVFIGSGEIVTANFGVKYNSATTLKPSTAGIELRRALAHLLEKSSFMTVPAIGGQADYDDIQAPPAQGLNNIGGSSGNSRLAQAVLNEDCSAHPWKNPCSAASAYNLSPDNIGGGARWWSTAGANAAATAGYSGPDDLRAACDHLVAAGFSLTSGTCLDVANAAAGTTPPGSYPHLVPTGQITMYIRTHAPRKAFGQIFADSINFLFGGNVVLYGGSPVPQYFTISQVADIVFSSVVPDDWHLYTGGWSLGSTPDHLWSLYNSAFSGGVCAGLAEEFPNDYLYYCSPAHDGDTSAGEFSSTLAEANELFKRAALSEHRQVMTVPVYSLVSRFVALNGWSFQPGPQSSLVSVLGHGFQTGFQSLLNMRQKPGYSPSNSIYNPGGGTPDLIRRGFSQDIHKLSPYHFTTVWDFEVLGQIFDSMLAVNPMTGGTGLQMVDWMTTSHSSSFNPIEVSCIGSNCVTGTTTQTWRLRNDIKWHDGPSVTADDVVYSILSYRDVPSANLQPNVATVSSAVALTPTTVQVKLQGQSPFSELNIGSVPIIPKHIWSPICGVPPNPASLCGDPGFDPMTLGLYVGSGPWVCKNINTGSVGGSCTQNANGSIGTQDVSLGGRVLLTANENYMRGPTQLQASSLQKLSWADKNQDGAVNILDIGDAALHYGAPDPYWDHPLFGVTNGIVDIGEIATVALYFDHGTTKPFLPASLIGLDPQIDPFRVDLTPVGGQVMYYQGGLRSGSSLTIRLVSLSGNPNPSSFTATLVTDSGATVGTVTGTAGSSPSIVLFQFSGVNPGRHRLTVSFSGQTQPVMVITLNA